ncbi:MAG: DUF6597 domain-containing transcriptional factor [Bacteroidales bacterium]
MDNVIKRYEVRHPFLRNYIKFFWEFCVDNITLDHSIISSRNINLRFNLSDFPICLSSNKIQFPLDKVFFSGFHNRHSNSSFKFSGKMHMLGVCFYPDGFFPFIGIPLNEFKNGVAGPEDIGIHELRNIYKKLRDSKDINQRLMILEEELLLMYKVHDHHNEFRGLYSAFQKFHQESNISLFCKENGLNIRKLERMFDKYIGVSAKTFLGIDRFQKSVNQLLYSDYNRLSDIAYENGYFDQMHFIREFKKFTSRTPRNFISANNSMFQVGKFV